MLKPINEWPQPKQKVDTTDFKAVHCPVCNKFLGRASVGSTVELDCRRCRELRVVEINIAIENVPAYTSARTLSA